MIVPVKSHCIDATTTTLCNHHLSISLNRNFSIEPFLNTCLKKVVDDFSIDEDLFDCDFTERIKIRKKQTNKAMKKRSNL